MVYAGTVQYLKNSMFLKHDAGECITGMDASLSCCLDTRLAVVWLLKGEYDFLANPSHMKSEEVLICQVFM